jgi:hypothetical protein
MMQMTNVELIDFLEGRMVEKIMARSSSNTSALFLLSQDHEYINLLRRQCQVYDIEEKNGKS